MRRQIVGLLVISALVMAVTATEVSAADHQEVRQVMGTLATVQAWAPDDPMAQAAVDTAFAVFDHVDSLMSTWNGNSPLSRLNAAPVATWIPVGHEVCHVLQAAIKVTHDTGGAFNPTVLPLVKLWGFRGGTPTLPSGPALAAALSLVDISQLQVADDQARLRRSGMALDLGGIAKGYALDRAVAAMLRVGAQGGVLDLGGNLFVFGQGAESEVGIVDPARPETLILTVPLSSGAVATSGQYERFVTVGGQAYGHVLDPRTGWPAASGFSATVLAPQALWADALATAALVLGVESGLKMLEGIPGVEGVIVGPDGIEVTSGLVGVAGPHRAQ